VRVSPLRLSGIAVALAAVAGCAGGSSHPWLPAASAVRANAAACASGNVQTEWIFKGSCQIGTIDRGGTGIALDPYRGFTVSGSIGRTTLKKKQSFAVVDATGKRDTRPYRGTPFPAYAAAGSKTLLYVEMVNAGPLPVRIKGKPAVELSIADANGPLGSGCGLALLVQSSSKKTAWTALPVAAKRKGNTYSASIRSLPAPLAGGAAYLAFFCATASPSPSPSPSPVPARYPTTTASSGPYGITAGPDGNLWFTEQTAGNVARITPSGNVTEFALPNECHSTIGDHPEGIVSGPGGDLWLAAPGCGALESVSTNGSAQTHPIAATGDCYQPEPHALTTGPDGNLWFTDAECDRIGFLDPSTFATTEYAAVDGYVGDIVAGPDGNLWFTLPFYNDAPYAGAIGRITPSGTTSFFALPQVPGGSAYPTPNDIAVGPDGKLWFTFVFSQGNNGGVGSITTSGAIVEHVPDVSLGVSNAGAIVKGKDGKLWFAYGSGIGSVTTAGAFAAYAVPLDGNASLILSGIAQTADGTLWFTNGTESSIGALRF
jgi:streptogramin lyase